MRYLFILFVAISALSANQDLFNAENYIQREVRRLKAG